MRKTFLFTFTLFFLLAGCNSALSEPRSTAEDLSFTPSTIIEPGNSSPAISTINPETTTLPDQEITQDSQGNLEFPSIVYFAVRDLSIRLKISSVEIMVVNVEDMNWPDASLGCPWPDLLYTQVITPGYRISLEAKGEIYTYHTDKQRAIVLCGQEGPILPVIPVKDDIKDGNPWMPVDPVPTAEEGEPAADPDPLK